MDHLQRERQKLVDFRHLCDLADVKGLRVELHVSSRLRVEGDASWRELEAIVLRAENGMGGAKEPIRSGINAAARRLLEVIT
jgi:hypothetical protein